MSNISSRSFRQTELPRARDDSIDAAKGVGIILVVIGHIPIQSAFISNWIFSFHMPFFFFISGFLLSVKRSWQTRNLKEQIIRSARSLLYPYAVFSLVSLLFCVYQQFVLNCPVNFADVIFRSVIGEGLLTLWFLPALFIAECCFYIFLKLKVLTPPFVLAIVAFSALVSRLLNTTFSFSSTWLAIHIVREIGFFNRGLIGFTFLYIGFVIQPTFNRLLKTKSMGSTSRFTGISALILVIISSMLCQNNKGVDMHYNKLGNVFLFYLFAFSSSLAILVLSKVYFAKIRMLRYFGKNSLIIMCTHLNCSVLLTLELLTARVPFFFEHPRIRIIVWILSVFCIEALIIGFIQRYCPVLIHCPDSIFNGSKNTHGQNRTLS